jgi:hypothetical protein
LPFVPENLLPVRRIELLPNGGEFRPRDQSRFLFASLWLGLRLSLGAKSHL